MAKKIKVTHDEEIMGTAKSSLKEELDQEHLIVEYGNPTFVGKKLWITPG